MKIFLYLLYSYSFRQLLTKSATNDQHFSFFFWNSFLHLWCTIFYIYVEGEREPDFALELICNLVASHIRLHALLIESTIATKNKKRKPRPFTLDKKTLIRSFRVSLKQRCKVFRYNRWMKFIWKINWAWSRTKEISILVYFFSLTGFNFWSSNFFCQIILIIIIIFQWIVDDWKI